MKKITYLLLGIFSTMGIVSCELEDNIDPKHASEVPVETLFTTAEIAFVDQYNNMNVNYNISRMLAQYWSDVTYTDGSRYDFQDRGIPDTFWAEFYRDVLMDLEESKIVIDNAGYVGALANKAINQKAIIEILEVYTYSVLAETFGDIPYSEATIGAENFAPKYDDAETVYLDLFVRLDAAIAALNSSFDSFGGEELLFDGDIAEWKTFANSLKLRMAMRMADVPAFNSQAKVEAAVAAGVYNSNLEGAFFEYIGTDPYVNTIYDGFVIDNRNDYCPSNTIIDKMVALNDPRLPLWFTQKDGAYVGIPFGLVDGVPYNNYSQFTEHFYDPKLEAILSDYAEMEFFLAEAVERGWNISGTAEEHYNNGITASILYYGGTQAEADAYLAQASVAYATAGGTWKEKIGTQKWLAMYNRGIEGWSEWRRLDAPTLNHPVGIDYADIPTRFPYPYSEKNKNPSYYDAADAIGGDTATTKLWWDKF
ncbi:SusD/RagB family nutrient-binding outer membrane lipoprotein [Labilibaculum antarcticum]|uniref:SusD/RagB family nutrient-binding outer membrane lipoprotein n=1 Tax=Labilibaculum antarcticum TaxID=1717717 RepID=A0A1Y1CG22_9BACT|nr:SusD/RagB family nutrient-binding outer membrane lipoprotein [Labilibaculum antarcticum]BAX78982.1 hypothetical protein ALGA_0592 [Labilibaculum antarcticum]